MQRYYFRFIIIAALLFSGCAIKQPKIDEAKIDAYLIQAAFLESSGLMETAAKLYAKLYNLTDSKLFLLKTVQAYYRAKKYKEALYWIDKGLKRYPKLANLYELKALAYLGLKRYDEAIKWINKAIALDRTPQNLELLASIYLTKKEYELALKYYKSAYALKPTDQIVNTIAYIMYFYLGKKREAIAYLETHSRIYGCSKRVCATLASLYGLQNNIDGLISVYKRLYETYRDEKYAVKLIEYLVYQNRIEDAVVWAKKAKADRVLLDLYRMRKAYDKAYEIAMRLFEKTKEYRYLAEAAIFEYEKSHSKDSKLLEDVAKKLETAIKHNVKDAVYYNYLGYLYIEHDLDIDRGIELVKKALRVDPDSPYYLDSLAWGYYKLGKCQKALPIMKRVYYDLGLKDPEVELHLKKIEACVKGKH